MPIPVRHPHGACVCVLSILLVTVGSGLAFSQQLIHVAVNMVNVAFSVRDARGALVENLTKDDIEVFEDAVPQKISFFARSTDVLLTPALAGDTREPGSYFFQQHERDLEVFLKEVLGPKDRAFLVTFANHIRLVSDFLPSGAGNYRAHDRV